MTKIFLDSNIWIRYFLHDNSQFEEVEKLIVAIEEGKFSPYTSAIVLLEICFVLQSYYKYPKSNLEPYLEAVLKLRSLTTIEKTNTDKALSYFHEHNIKFSDCLIASQIPKDMILVTFDKEFDKIKAVSSKAPAELLS